MCTSCVVDEGRLGPQAEEPVRRLRGGVKLRAARALALESKVVVQELAPLIGREEAELLVVGMVSSTAAGTSVMVYTRARPVVSSR